MKYKLLIIDDFNISNEITGHSLEKAGFEIYMSQNAKDALMLVQHNKFDLIITDFNMPIMNGFDLLVEIRKMQGYELTPVIFLSSVVDQDVKKKVLEHSNVSWVKKPFDLFTIVLTIENALK